MRGRGKADATVFHDGVISALVARRGGSERVALHLEGRFAFDLSTVVAERAGLRVGEPLSAEQQSELYRQDEPFRAREQALRYLSARDRSKREVENRLRKAGFDPALIEGTLAWLAGLGYLDDRRFASAYAAEKRRTGWGDRRIRAELAAKGVERSAVEEVLSDLREADPAGATEGEEAVERIVRKRFSSQFAIDPDAAERRLAGFLTRRGYDWDAIAKLARTLRADALAAQQSGNHQDPGVS